MVPHRRPHRACGAPSCRHLGHHRQVGDDLRVEVVVGHHPGRLLTFPHSRINNPGCDQPIPRSISLGEDPVRFAGSPGGRKVGSGRSAICGMSPRGRAAEVAWGAPRRPVPARRRAPVAHPRCAQSGVCRRRPSRMPRTVRRRRPVRCTKNGGRSECAHPRTLGSYRRVPPAATCPAPAVSVTSPSDDRCHQNPARCPVRTRTAGLHGNLFRRTFTQVSAVPEDGRQDHLNGVHARDPLSRTFHRPTGRFSSFSPVWCTDCPRWTIKMISQKREKAQ
jgi:hypothetical protein